MATFKYKAKNRNGAEIVGEMDASSKQECIQQLRNEGLYILSVEENNVLNKDVLKYEIDFQAIFTKLFGSYSYKQLAAFCSSLNFLLQSGMTVYQSISLVKNQSDKRMKKVLAKVERDLDSGMSFHEALSEHPLVFPKLIIELIRTGEASGNLEKITEELAVYYEEQQMIRSQIVTVMVYPVITIILTILVMNYILLTVVPSISQMLIEYDAELPFITRVVMAASDIIRNYWYFAILGTIVFIIALRHVLGIPKVKEKLDWVWMKFPLTSPIVLGSNLTRFSRTLAVLLNSGIPLTRALDMSENILGNRVLLKGIIYASRRLEHGEYLSDSLADSKAFPESFVELIRVGERSGNIDQVLFKMAEQYGRLLQQNVKRLSSLLEPLLMLVVASVVGFLMISMFMPMVTLMNSMA